MKIYIYIFYGTRDQARAGFLGEDEIITLPHPVGLQRLRELIEHAPRLR